MKRIHTTLKVLFLLTLTVCAVLLASCGGSLKLESMSIDTSTVPRSCIVGETLDFTGIKVYVTYNDETLNRVYTYSELTLEYDENMTDAVGTYTVKVSFADPNLDGQIQMATFTVFVNPDPSDVQPGGEKLNLELFAQADAILTYLQNNKANPDLQFGNAAFLNQYIEQKALYTVGDDNVFRYLPKLAVGTDTGFAVLSSYYAPLHLYYKGFPLIREYLLGYF